MKKNLALTSTILFLSCIQTVFSQSVESRLNTSPDEILVTCTEVRHGNYSPKKNANSITLIWSDSKKTTRIITDDREYSSMGPGMNAVNTVPRRLYIGRQVKIDNSEITFLSDADAGGWIAGFWRLDRSSAILKSYNPEIRQQVYDTYKCIKGSSKL